MKRRIKILLYYNWWWGEERRITNLDGVGGGGIEDDDMNSLMNMKNEYHPLFVEIKEFAKLAIEISITKSSTRWFMAKLHYLPLQGGRKTLIMSSFKLGWCWSGGWTLQDQKLFLVTHSIWGIDYCSIFLYYCIYLVKRDFMCCEGFYMCIKHRLPSLSTEFFSHC